MNSVNTSTYMYMSKKDILSKFVNILTVRSTTLATFTFILLIQSFEKRKGHFPERKVKMYHKSWSSN